MSFRQIRAFVTVAQLGSFTRAAAALHLSQPALTVQIRNLEAALHCRLLDRNSRSVALTRTGRELLPRLQRTLQDMDAVVAETREAGAGRRGTVRIAALPSFAASLLPDVILACRAAQPGIGFVVRDAVATQVMQLVREEQVDLGLTGGDVDAAEFDTLHQWADRLCLVAPAEHPVARRRQLRLAHFADQPLVLTDNTTSVRACVDEAFRTLGRLPLVACETTYMMTAVAMVRAGLGLTILPGAARELRAEPGLVARPIAEAAFVRTISLIKRRGRTLPPAGEDFLAASIAATAGI